MSRPAPSIAQVQGKGVIGVPGSNPDRRLHGMPVCTQPHDIAARDAQFLSGSGTDQSSVVPGQLGERFWEFLQPAVIGETSVANRGVWPQHDFDCAGADRPAAGGTGSGAIDELDRLGSESGIRHEAVVQGSLPELFESGLRLLPLPIASYHVMAGGARFSGEHGHKFVR